MPSVISIAVLSAIMPPPCHAYPYDRRHICVFSYHDFCPGNDHHVSHNVFPDSDHHNRDDRNHSADPDNQHSADDLSNYYSAANKHRCTNSHVQNIPIEYMPHIESNADANYLNDVLAHANRPAIDVPKHGYVLL